MSAHVPPIPGAIVEVATAAPLTASDCDLRDFQFMPLDVQRLRDSDLAAMETPEACWAAVQLWGASWHQIPAASLPDDDRVLAQLAGYGRVVREWLRVKAGALRGFVRCSDGRLYHPVVAEKAREAWRGKLEQRWRTECARIKKHNQRTGEEVPAPTLQNFLRDRGAIVSPGTNASVPADSSACPQGQTPVSPPSPPGNTIQGKGKGKGTDSSEANASGAEAPEDIERATWNAAVRLLVDRGGETEQGARSFIGKLLSANGLVIRDMTGAVYTALANATGDPKGYLAKAAQGIAKRRAPVTPKRLGFV